MIIGGEINFVGEINCFEQLNKTTRVKDRRAAGGKNPIARAARSWREKQALWI
jgi:hypothetical protein